MSERLLAIHARLQELTEDVLALIHEEREAAKRAHHRPRFEEPSHDAPAIACHDYYPRPEPAPFCNAEEPDA